MNSESHYEKLYNMLIADLEEMHRRNVSRTGAALKSLLIIPTVFLIMLFLTGSSESKTVFLILWIASMFVIAAVLIIIEYQDYLLRKVFSQVDDTDNPGEADSELSSAAEANAEAEAVIEEEAEEVIEDATEEVAEAVVGSGDDIPGEMSRIDEIRQAILSRAPEHSEDELSTNSQ